MIEHTQSDTATGNCWQTCVACILEVDPAALPAQVEIEADKRSYQNSLNVYLFKHHGLCYTVMYDFMFPIVLLREPGWHMMEGPTVRTPNNGGREHVVVGRHGVMAWDPHPSRAGLTYALRWSFLVPPPARAVGYWVDKSCECPACTPRP